jgi:hypothetical protein
VSKANINATQRARGGGVIKHYALLDGTFSSHHHHHTMQTGPKLDGMVAEKWVELELGAVKSFPHHGCCY